MDAKQIEAAIRRDADTFRDQVNAADLDEFAERVFRRLGFSEETIASYSAESARRREALRQV